MAERRAATEKAEKDQRYSRACINLQRSQDPNFREYVKRLVDEYIQASFQNNILEGLPLARSQGEAQCLARKIEEVLGAPAAMAQTYAAMSQRVVRGRGNLGSPA
jgi:hypothetical protein